jgi:hypothetical protein
MLNILRKAWEGLAIALTRPINKVAALVLSIYTFLWGVWLANPFWKVFENVAVYSWLENIAPEVYWGAIAMSVGAIMTYGVIRSSYRSLTIGAFVGFIHWLIIAMGYFAGDWKNTGGITSSAMALYCAAIYLNIRYVHYQETHQQ